jgi:hypothetical protein
MAQIYRARIVCDTSNNSAFPAILAPLLGGRPSDRLVAGVITNALTHAAVPAPIMLTLAGQRVGIPRWTLSKRELIEACRGGDWGRLAPLRQGGRLGGAAGRV